jgi:hypothetical protein
VSAGAQTQDWVVTNEAFRALVLCMNRSYRLPPVLHGAVKVNNSSHRALAMPQLRSFGRHKESVVQVVNGVRGGRGRTLDVNEEIVSFATRTRW